MRCSLGHPGGPGREGRSGSVGRTATAYRVLSEGTWAQGGSIGSELLRAQPRVWSDCLAKIAVWAADNPLAWYPTAESMTFARVRHGNLFLPCLSALVGWVAIIEDGRGGALSPAGWLRPASWFCHLSKQDSSAGCCCQSR